jgi:hypothetical protein
MDTALAAWLADDDATALSALTAMAQAGDERAMLFLGAVEARAAPTYWLLALDRKTRNALLRQPGGLSGHTWLDAVVAARPMADALMAATRDFDPGPLIALGQMSAAQTAVLRMLYNDPGKAALIDAVTPMPNGLRHLIWTEAAFVTPFEMGYALSDVDLAVCQAALADAAAAENHTGLQHLMFAGAPDDLCGVMCR